MDGRMDTLEKLGSQFLLTEPKKLELTGFLFVKQLNDFICYVIVVL